MRLLKLFLWGSIHTRVFSLKLFAACTIFTKQIIILYNLLGIENLPDRNQRRFSYTQMLIQVGTKPATQKAVSLPNQLRQQKLL